MLFQIFISRMIEPSEGQRPSWQNCTADEKYTVIQRERGGQCKYLISANSAFTVVNTLFDERESISIET